MDLNALRDGMNAAVPFIRHVGLELQQVEPGRAVVLLPDEEHLANHVGSRHAGALFTAGETASGGAFVGAVAERLAELRPLVRGASITYTKVARGPITATGTLDRPVDELLAAVEGDGAVDFAIDVHLTDESGDLVARMNVEWNVKRVADRQAA